MITVYILTVGMFILMFGKYLLRLVTHRNCGKLIIFVFRSMIEYSLHKVRYLESICKLGMKHYIIF